MSYVSHGFANLTLLGTTIRVTASASRFTTPGVKTLFNLGPYRYQITIAGRVNNAVPAYLYIGSGNNTLVYDTSVSLGTGTTDTIISYIFDNSVTTYSQVYIGVLMHKPSVGMSMNISYIRAAQIVVQPAADPFTNLLAGIYKAKINAVVNIYGISTANQAYLGTGFFVSSDGYIVTAGHVAVAGTTVPEPYAKNLFVQVYPENTVSAATIIGVDRKYDVAVLKINTTGRTFLEWANSRNANIGSIVAAIGEPLGAHVQNVTMGVMSDNKCQDYSWMPESITTDAAIIGGNSGGPLLTDSGTVIGIVSWAITNGGYQLSGAIASNIAKLITNSIIGRHKQGDAPPLDFPSSYFGVEFVPVDLVATVALNLPRVEGVRITSVAAGSTAAAAGIVAGDVIISANGHTVGRNNSQEPFGTIVHFIPPGGALNLIINRGGRILAVNSTVSAMPPSQDILFANKQTLSELMSGCKCSHC